MASAKQVLIVALPEGSVKHYLLSADTITVGRDSSNSIVLEWDTVSSHHCELRWEKGGFLLRDLGSTNGTEVNGKLLQNEPQMLKDSDAIVIGLNVKARLVEVEEIVQSKAQEPKVNGAATQRLVDPKLPPMPSINPVAAAVAKATKSIGGN